MLEIGVKDKDGDVRVEGRVNVVLKGIVMEVKLRDREVGNVWEVVW